MTQDTLRRLRLGLVAAGILVTAAVVLTLRGTRVAPQPSPPPASARAGAGQTRVGGFVYRKFKEGKEAFVLEAESWEGSEQQEVRLSGGLRVRFPYVSRGERGEAQVTADTGSYAPAQDTGRFEGHVRITTADGVELTTDSLLYRGERGVARTDAPVAFRRKDVSGSATGMVYHADDRSLELLADARLRVEGEGAAPPLEIRGARAAAGRDEGVLRFAGGVEAARGADRLTAERLTIVFSTEDESLAGVEAEGSVVLEASGRQALPGAPGLGTAGGRRLLKAKRLDVYFRQDRTLSNATAGPNADLTLWPAPGEPNEKRRITARMLTFRFDEQGRLLRVHAQKDARILAEDLAPAREKPRSLSCRNFTAGFNPATGEVRSAAFRGEVEIARGTQRSRSQDAAYDGAAGRLRLTGNPELTDSADASRLTARTVEISTASGNVRARTDVTHVLGSRPRARRLALVDGGEAPAVVRCGSFEHEAKMRQTRYRDGAVLRSGKDELRAPTIRLRELRNGERRLQAGPGVVSVFHPRPSPGKAASSPIETRAASVVYDEKANQALYEGEVTMRQGDITSRSPKASVSFSPDGGSVERVVAGQPVEVSQELRLPDGKLEKRQAAGTTASYDPQNETLELVGEKVTLRDSKNNVSGRKLTLHLPDDRILVDGGEIGRTETILKKEPKRP
jgi:lipopolysaccharide transport protein LptA/LPS export ABC transporter protein LptC